MLLQITEPPLPEQESPPPLGALGIDLGTTHCVAAYVQDNQPHVIDLGEGPLLPSVVTCSLTGEYSIGTMPPFAAKVEAGVTFSSFKRHMDQPSQRLATLKTPVELAAFILKYIKQKAEQALKHPVYDAVITVPAYFDDTARQATKDAAQLAGFKVLRLLNEPTAAALSYGLDHQVEGIYAVYDWGGGTFDVSLLKMTKGVFQVLATAGDIHLGGDDIDQAILDFWLLSRDVDSVNGLIWARQAKETLFTKPLWAQHGLTLSQSDLSQLAKPFVERTLEICRHVLKDANLSLADIQGVVLVGGSTRLQEVRRAVEEFFQKPPLTNLDPDQVVALGAALQAHALTHGSKTLLLDVTPLSLGLETMGGLVEKIIVRNTPIPAAVSQEFTTYQDGQTQMKIHIVQGERELVQDCRSLAEFTLKGIPPMAAGLARIEVTFSLDSDGLLTVTACEKTTQISQKIDIKPSYGLSEEDLQRMVQESFSHSAQDIQQRLLREACLKAEKMIEDLQTALKDDKHLLLENEKEEFTEALNSLQTLIRQEKQATAIYDHVQHISVLTRPFSERKIAATLREHLKKLS